jgi:hypothetical protein
MWIRWGRKRLLSGLSRTRNPLGRQQRSVLCVVCNTSSLPPAGHFLIIFYMLDDV